MHIKAPLTVRNVFPHLGKRSPEHRKLSWMLGQKCVYCNQLMKDHDFSSEVKDSLPFICPKKQE